MSRITAPVSKLTRSLNTASTRSSPLLDSQRNAGAVLMPKYAELLRNRNRSAEHSDVRLHSPLTHWLCTRYTNFSQSSRHIYTTHRPTPQPSLANRTKPLMQTFHTSVPSQAPAGHLDATVLPRLHETSTPEPEPFMPLLPDNYGAFHVLETAELKPTTATILAANPENVVPGSPMASIDTVNLDGVELKFAHETPAEQKDEGSFLGDIWRGMVDDVFGAVKKTT